MMSAYSNQDGRLTVADCAGYIIINSKRYCTRALQTVPAQFRAVNCKHMLDKVLPGGLCCLCLCLQICSLYVGWLFCSFAWLAACCMLQGGLIADTVAVELSMLFTFHCLFRIPERKRAQSAKYYCKQAKQCTTRRRGHFSKRESHEKRDDKECNTLLILKSCNRIHLYYIRVN